MLLFLDFQRCVAYIANEKMCMFYAYSKHLLLAYISALWCIFLYTKYTNI